MRNLLDITIPLLGASILDLHAKYGAKLRKKASGHALELPPIGRRRRHSYALLEVDDTSKRVRELVVMFPMATDSDQVRAEFVRRWGKPKRSREHKCMLRGCVYGTTPKVVIKEIDTRLMWSIRVMSK